MVISATNKEDEFVKGPSDLNVRWIYKLKRRLLVWLSVFLALFVVITSIFVVSVLEDSLHEDCMLRMHGLSNSIEAAFRILMLEGSPELIQLVIDNIAAADELILGISILDQDGWVAFSSEEEEFGRLIDEHEDPTCNVCHMDLENAPSETIVVTKIKGQRAHRKIKTLFSEAPCFECHVETEGIYGKIIIDRSLEQTYSLIATIRLIVVGSAVVLAVVLLAVLVPFLSKKVNRYINEILYKNMELSLLYRIVERLSKTIDLEDLKCIALTIVGDALEADEVYIIMPDPVKHSASAWLRSTNEITRKNVSEDGLLSGVAQRWAEGTLDEVTISEDSRAVFMPVMKSDIREVLIVARKHTGTFDPTSNRLINAMVNHIAVAFENARLYKIAITDERTQLYTPRHFNTCIDMRISIYRNYNERFTLLMLDIDDFKKVNDTYGHMVGDSVLKDMAAQIRLSIRDNDLSFRYGGEEFSVIIPSSGALDGERVAERIRRNIQEKVFEKGVHDLRLTISIGVSTCPDNAETAHDIVLTADNALYEAKGLGKNRFVVSKEKRKA